MGCGFWFFFVLKKIVGLVKVQEFYFEEDDWMLLLCEMCQKMGFVLKVEKCEGKFGKLQGIVVWRKERGFVFFLLFELKELKEFEIDGLVEFLWFFVLCVGNYLQEKILMNYQCFEEEFEIYFLL